MYSSIILVAALLTTVFVMYSRWNDARLRDRANAEQQAEKQREGDRLAVEQLGGKGFAILDFYASPRTIRRGESAKLCYGVSNAKGVTLEPQTSAVWPSAAHCVDVSPRKTTTYALTIRDAEGHTQSQRSNWQSGKPARLSSNSPLSLQIGSLYNGSSRGVR